MTFAGWIPNIAGRLSFTSLSSSYLTRSAINIPVQRNCEGARFVVAHHRRVTNDEPSKAIVRALSFTAVRRLALLMDWYPHDTFDHFAVLRGSDCDDYLLGRVYIVRHGETARYWRSVFARFNAEIAANGIVGAAHETRLCEAFVEHLHELATEENPANFMVADVWVERSGKTTVSCSEKGPVTWPPSAYERSAQVFRFIRDLFHAHYHHPDGDDAFTGLSATNDPRQWALETDRSLYRSVLSARRRRHPAYLAEAKGRLAYLRAFHERFDGLVPSRQLSELDQSIDALHSQVAHRDEISRLVTTVLLLAPFALVELLTHLSELAHDPGSSSHERGTIANFLTAGYWAASNNVPLALAILTALGVLYGSSTRLLRPELWPLVRAIVRAFTLPLRTGQRWPVIVALVSGVALILGGTWLLLTA